MRQTPRSYTQQRAQVDSGLHLSLGGKIRGGAASSSGQGASSGRTQADGSTQRRTTAGERSKAGITSKRVVPDSPGKAAGSHCSKKNGTDFFTRLPPTSLPSHLRNQVQDVGWTSPRAPLVAASGIRQSAPDESASSQSSGNSRYSFLRKSRGRRPSKPDEGGVASFVTRSAKTASAIVSARKGGERPSPHMKVDSDQGLMVRSLLAERPPKNDDGIPPSELCKEVDEGGSKPSTTLNVVGLLESPSGDWKYKGTIHKGQRHGVGVTTLNAGGTHAGTYREGQIDGAGILSKKSAPNGKSELTYGFWLLGVKHGAVVQTDSTNEEEDLFEKWENGELKDSEPFDPTKIEHVDVQADASRSASRAMEVAALPLGTTIDCGTGTLSPELHEGCGLAIPSPPSEKGLLEGALPTSPESRLAGTLQGGRKIGSLAGALAVASASPVGERSPPSTLKVEDQTAEDSGNTSTTKWGVVEDILGLGAVDEEEEGGERIVSGRTRSSMTGSGVEEAQTLSPPREMLPDLRGAETNHPASMVVHDVLSLMQLVPLNLSFRLPCKPDPLGGKADRHRVTRSAITRDSHVVASRLKAKISSAGSDNGVIVLFNNNKNCVEKRLQQKLRLLSFESSFEGSNVRLISVSENHTVDFIVPIFAQEEVYDVFLRGDGSKKEHTGWFYFRILGKIMPRTTYRFNIRNLRKSSSLFQDGQLPLIMELHGDEKSGEWRRVKGDCCYYVSPLRRVTTALICSTYPYVYSDVLALVRRLEAMPHVKVSCVAESLCGNPCYALTVSGESDSRKPIVVVCGRVHPGESVSSFVMEAFCDFILSDQEEAERLRELVTIVCVPCLNPDGVVHGLERVNLAGLDLNRQWLSPSVQLSPTIHAVKSMIQSMGSNVKVFLDLHGHSRQRGCFFYGCGEQRVESKTWDRIMNASVPTLRPSSFKEKGKEATGRVVCGVHGELNIPYSYTLEVSHCGPYFGSKASNPVHYSAGDFLRIGEGVAKGLSRLFVKLGESTSTDE